MAATNRSSSTVVLNNAGVTRKTGPEASPALATTSSRCLLTKRACAAFMLAPNGKAAHFIARLKGNGSERPLLIAAHTDVVPADKPGEDALVPSHSAMQGGAAMEPYHVCIQCRASVIDFRRP
jgi:hypothetical protein